MKRFLSLLAVLLCGINMAAGDQTNRRFVSHMYSDIKKIKVSGPADLEFFALGDVYTVKVGSSGDLDSQVSADGTLIVSLQGDTVSRVAIVFPYGYEFNTMIADGLHECDLDDAVIKHARITCESNIRIKDSIITTGEFITTSGNIVLDGIEKESKIISQAIVSDGLRKIITYINNRV